MSSDPCCCGLCLLDQLCPLPDKPWDVLRKEQYLDGCITAGELVRVCIEGWVGMGKSADEVLGRAYDLGVWLDKQED